MSLYHYLRRSLLLILPLLLGILTFGVAYANEVKYSDNIPNTPTDWTGTMTLPQFNPALGDLIKVVITSTGTVTGGGVLTNTGPNLANFVITHKVNLAITLPTNTVITNGLAVSQTIPLAANQSAGLPIATATKGAVDVFANPVDLFPFIGLNVVSIPVTATGNSTVSGSGNYDLLLRSKAASIVVEIAYIYLVPGIDIEKLTNGNDADDPNGGDVPQIPPAGTVNWSYVVKNTGQVTFTLAEVQVTDSHTGITPVFDPTSDNGDNLLAPGETWLYRAAGVAQNLLLPTPGTTVVNGCDAANVGNRRATYENIGTVVARNVTDSDLSHYCNPPAPGIEIKKFTNGQDADNANGVDVPLVAAGGPVTWTYAVRNTGNISFTLAEVQVTDDQPGVTPAFVSSSDNGDNILSPGESWLYRATGVAQTLLAPNPGVTVVNGCDPGNTGLTRPAYENIGKVVVRSLTDTDPSHYCNPPGPGITIKKFTNGQDANDPDGGDVPEIPINNTVTWTYIITNTGIQPFAEQDVQVTDSQPGITPTLLTKGNGDAILSPGESWTYRATGVAQNLLITNSTITIVPGCDPSQSGIKRATYENVGAVVVNTLTASDPSHYCNPPVPGIIIKKFTNGQDADNADGNDVPLVAPGATVNWSYIVTNTGNVPFPQAAVLVTDSQPGVTTVLDATSDNGDGILSPGEHWLYKAAGIAQNLLAPAVGVTVVPGCDPANTTIKRVAYENIGRVQVNNLNNTDPSHYCNPPVPGIIIKKFTNGQDADNADGNDVPLVAPGATVTWSYIVTNTGNVPFKQVDMRVTDSHSGVIPVLDATSDNGDGILSPGEDWLYKATGSAQNLLQPSAGTTVVNGCDPANTTIKRPAYENIGRVQVNNLNGSDPSHYCNPPAPGIAIKKYTNGQDADDPNGRDVPSIDFTKAVTWTYVVSNTGNVPFTQAEVKVTDSHKGVTPVLVVNSDNGDGLLLPGEQWLYRATGIAFNLSIQNSSITVVDGCNPNGLPIKNAAYMNIGTVLVGTLTASDPSHYCNPKPTALNEDAEPVGSHGSRFLFLPMVRAQ